MKTLLQRWIYRTYSWGYLACGHVATATSNSRYTQLRNKHKMTTANWKTRWF